jgi:hypothetical protein
MDALDNYSLQTRGHSGLLEVIRDLNEMKVRLIRAMTMIERAEPLEVEVPTAATLRDSLILAIYDALQESDLQVTLSSKESVGSLTPFERLLLSLGINRGQSDQAFAMMVRRAVQQK